MADELEGGCDTGVASWVTTVPQPVIAVQRKTWLLICPRFAVAPGVGRLRAALFWLSVPVRYATILVASVPRSLLYAYRYGTVPWRDEPCTATRCSLVELELNGHRLMRIPNPWHWAMWRR